MRFKLWFNKSTTLDILDVRLDMIIGESSLILSCVETLDVSIVKAVFFCKDEKWQHHLIHRFADNQLKNTEIFDFNRMGVHSDFSVGTCLWRFLMCLWWNQDHSSHWFYKWPIFESLNLIWTIDTPVYLCVPIRDTWYQWPSLVNWSYF